jgi:hypothetical protein
MGTFAAPFGCRAVFHPSGTVRQKSLTGFSSIPASGVSKGDLIKLTGDAYVASIITANDASIGIFEGCRYTAADGTPVESPYWPASLSGVTNIEWFYTPFDPGLECEIQGASGSWASTAIGDSADMVIAAGSAYTGISGSYLSATLKGAGAVGNFRIIGLGQQADNAWSDSYPILRVQIAKNQILTEANSI